MKEWSLQDNNRESSRKCAQSSETYTDEFIRVVQAVIQKQNLERTTSRCHETQTPFSTSKYKAELEATSYCDAYIYTIYLNLIGILR